MHFVRQIVPENEKQQKGQYLMKETGQVVAYIDVYFHLKFKCCALLNFLREGMIHEPCLNVPQLKFHFLPIAAFRQIII